MKAAFPGSFDPPTLGHMNIIQRSAAIFDEIVVVVAENRLKTYFFSAVERFSLISTLVRPWNNVSVAVCGGLIVDFLAERGIPLIIRGVRGGDFSYEFELAMMNKALKPEIETIFVPSEVKYGHVSSSAIKELVSFGGDISSLVPPEVERALYEKSKEITKQVEEIRAFLEKTRSRLTNIADFVILDLFDSRVKPVTF